MPWTREENILRHNLFGDKIIENCLKIDVIIWYENDLLERQETQKRIACPGSWYNNNKTNIDLMSLHFWQDVFQMTAIVHFSLTNHYQINELHLFSDTLYYQCTLLFWFGFIG